MGGYRRTHPEVTGQTCDKLGEWFAAGKLHAKTGHSFPLEQAADALTMLTTRQATGKVVITVR